VDAERAETYLRVMAETELRRVVQSLGGSLPLEEDPASRYMARMRYVATALMSVGAIDADLAEMILGDLEAALALRSRPGPRALLPDPGVPAAAWLMATAPRPSSPPAGQAGQVRAVPVGRTVRIRGETSHADLYLLSLIQTSDRFWFAVTGTTEEYLQFHPFRAVDDRGIAYVLQFSGGYDDGKTEGWLMAHRTPSADIKWLELYPEADAGAARVMVDVTAGPTPAGIQAEPADPASPGERLLEAIGASILARLPYTGAGPVALDETVAALEAAGALPPGSPGPGRLAALCQRTGLGPGAGLAATLSAGDAPPPVLPEVWTSVLAYFGRRHRPTAKVGAAPLAVILPELDGMRFVLAGLWSGPGAAQLLVLAFDLPFLPECRWLDPELRWNQWFPWWVRDSTGQWHVATVGGFASAGGGLTSLTLEIVPPLPRLVTQLDVIATGPSGRLRATVPLDWESP
jgi:hypothetical protein